MKRASDMRGFTLIELMIAVAIGVLATTMVFGLFVAQQRAMSAQRETVDIQDNSRIAMEMLTRDVRNAGFLLTSAIANSVRIEDNCRAGVDLGYTAATQAWTIGGGFATAQTATGNVVGTPLDESCPVGSDRLSVVLRNQINAAGTCDITGCLTNNVPLDASISVPCATAAQGGCQATLDSMSGSNGFQCPSGGPYAPARNINACVVDDPGKCVTMPVTNHTCNLAATLACTYASGAGADCVTFTLDPAFNGAIKWGGIGAGTNPQAKDLVAVNAFTFRTYQLLDVDVPADGALELVYSDNLHNGLISQTPGSIDPEWVTVANFIDDFQLTWENAGAVAHTTRLMNFVPCPVGAWDCLSTALNTQPTRPLTLIASLVARSERKERNTTDTVSKASRGPLENNSPALQPFSTNAATIASYFAAPNVPCPAPLLQNYERCTGNGNAQGFRRRLITERIGLRNLAGL